MYIIRLICIQKTGTDSLLNQKQSILSNITGSDIELLSTNQLRRIFGIDGVAVSIYLNLNDANDPKKYNIQISGAGLQSSINSLTNTVNVNTLDIR